LVDYQNVQDIDPSIFDLEFVRVVVFLGKSESKLPTEFVCGMQQLGDRASYIRIKEDGKNAVDFIITYELGRLASTEPGAYFHIVSKDKGFDPLVGYLASKSIRAKRWDRPGDVLPLKPALAKSTAERASVYMEIRGIQSNRPKSLKTFRGSLQAMFPFQPEDELERIEALLAKRKYVLVDGEKVTYPTVA